MYNQIILMYCIPLFSVLVITECGVMGILHVMHQVITVIIMIKYNI